jgi:hypothetical protein
VKYSSRPSSEIAGAYCKAVVLMFFMTRAGRRGQRFRSAIGGRVPNALQQL